MTARPRCEKHDVAFEIFEVGDEAPGKTVEECRKCRDERLDGLRDFFEKYATDPPADTPQWPPAANWRHEDAE